MTFAKRFKEGVETLRLTDEEIASHFSASVRTANLWRSGKSKPTPALRILILDELNALLEQHRKRILIAFVIDFREKHYLPSTGTYQAFVELITAIEENEPQTAFEHGELDDLLL